MPFSAANEYDCLVLSGGGANGAYGAGAAKALEVYRQLKGIARPVCYIGTSAGALNAYMLAAEGADALVAFWRKMGTRDVLGTDETPTVKRLLARLAFCAARRRPFSMYDNDALRAFLQKHATLEKLKSPLILAVTDFTSGGLRAFYHSEVVERVVAEDAKAAERSRRLKHMRRIVDDEMLINAMLASTAIPIFFPPVDIQVVHSSVTEASSFVDGGVGNNTPTREAAYLSRYLEKMGEGTVNTVFCVTQDPPRIFNHGMVPKGLIDIVQRTMDVFQYVHTTPIVDGWTRINREVEGHRAKVDEIGAWLDDRPIPPKTRDEIKARVEEALMGLGGQTTRLTIPFVRIGPTNDLGDFLNFDPKASEKRIETGYVDGLKALAVMRDEQHPGEYLLDDAEHKSLLNRPIWTS